MPASPSFYSQNRPSRRSRSSSPYPLTEHNVTNASHSHAAVSVYTHSSDGLCVPAQDVLTAGTVCTSSPSNLIHLQHSTGPLGVYRAPNGQPSQMCPAVAPTSVVDSIFAPNRTDPRNLATRSLVLNSHLPGSQPQNPSSFLPVHSRQSLGLERQWLLDKDRLPPRDQNQGIFNHARDFVMTNPQFVDNSIGNITNSFSNSNFMKELLKETIPGAAADSSARDPPPRCHPGTRLAILERCLYFIGHCNGVEKMRWVVGAAGVGKSAVMQSVAESPHLVVASNASVFFSINGRSDGTKVIMTLSYQFAAKSELYRQVIEDQVSRDPSLLQSSMSVQFEKFIVQPFIRNVDINTAGRVLVIIDGLDECSNTRIQVELLRLISDFCISYPSSPIVWLIASRPEPHILSFFSRLDVIPAYQKEEIPVNSDEARADVERFLRYELVEIGRASNFLGSHWPGEQDLWKLANAAGGLFAYAHTAIRYIGDSNVGDPVSQLSDVLNVIDELPLSDVPREQHPMALLDALYTRILSKVPAKIMINARKLLLLLVSRWDFALKYQREKNLVVMCNWLGMTADEAYAALNRLGSVLIFPQHHNAYKGIPTPFHKSFVDYTSRSELFPDLKSEAQQVKSQCAFRVLKEAPDGIDFDTLDYSFHYGWLARHSGTGNKISIIWQAEEGTDWNDDKVRLIIYKLAMGEVVAGMKRGDSVFQSDLCIKLLTTRFKWHGYGLFPYHELRDFVFAKSRCHEFVKHGILKHIPANAMVISPITADFDIKLQFHRRLATTTLPDPWNSACRHERVGRWKQGKEQNWTTVFDPERCTPCLERLECQLNTWITRHPDHVVSIMFASTERSCVELPFVDPEDGVSEWTYWFWIRHSSKERKELESSA